MNKLLVLPLLFGLTTARAQYIDASFGQSYLSTTEIYSSRANTISIGLNYPMGENWEGFNVATKVYVSQGQPYISKVRVEDHLGQPDFLNAETTHTQKTILFGFTIRNKKQEMKPYPSFGIMLGYSLYDMTDRITESKFRHNDYQWEGSFDSEANEHNYSRGSVTFSAQLRYHLPLTEVIDSHAGVFLLMGGLDGSPSPNAGVELGGSINLGSLL